MKDGMNSLKVKVLNSVTSFLGHLDHVLDHHPVFVAIGILYLLMLLAVLFTVYVIRRKAKGLIKPGPRIIFIEPNIPPRPPELEPPFDPFPPPHHSASCDCHGEERH
jgi:hypothetical protein